MNIVLVVDQFDHSNNGTTVTARRFAEQLRRRGHTVAVLAGGEPCAHKICAPAHRVPFFQTLIESQGMCFAKPDDEAYYQAFKNADVVHFYLPFRFCREGEKIARQMGVPAVAAFHARPENISSSIMLGKSKLINDFLYKWFYDRFYNRFRHIHCPSEFIAHQLGKHGYDARLWVVSNGVDESFVPMPGMRPVQWTGRFVILMIGRLSREKRQDLVIKAALRSKYRDQIKLVFAGIGPKEDEYRRLAYALENKPVFGFYERDALIRLINGCDLYVHASDAEIEGIGCMEALACGLVPVISDSPLSATKQFALDGRCLFRAGDADDLAQKIDYFFEHPEERARLSALYAAQQQQNRVKDCVMKAEEIYAAAIADKKARRIKERTRSALSKAAAPNPDFVRGVFCMDLPIVNFLHYLATDLIAPLLLLINWLFSGLRVEGREYLYEIGGGAVTVMNHVHSMDCAMLKVALFPTSVTYISLEDNLLIPFTGWLIAALGGIPLPKRVHEMARLQRTLVEKLKRKRFIHYYPEGMLVRYHEGIRDFHHGAFVTAVQANCPVLPMALCYRPARGIWAWRSKPCLTLRIGRPLYPRADLSPRQAAEDLKTRAHIVMEELQNERTDPLFSLEHEHI